MGYYPVILALDVCVLFEYLVPMFLVVIVEVLPIYFYEILGPFGENFVRKVGHHLHFDNKMTVKIAEVKAMVLAGSDMVSYNLIPDASWLDFIQLLSLRILISRHKTEVFLLWLTCKRG